MIGKVSNDLCVVCVFVSFVEKFIDRLDEIKNIDMKLTKNIHTQQ